MIRTALLAFFLIMSPAAFAKGGHGGGYSGHNSNYCGSCPRDSSGRIERSSSATREFKNETGYPNGRPGYVIDHVVPLKRGGADSPSNMQWQTKGEARAKDKWE